MYANNMADGHTCECSSKIGFPSSQNHSQISNSANTTRHNTEQDNLVVKSSLELTWTGDFKSLKSFLCNNMKLQGEWTQPGGDKKVFTGNSFCVTWRKGKKLLNFEGTDSNKIKRAFCMELCDMQEFKQVHQSVNSIDMCINSCPTTCKYQELSVDLEGVKLEQVISQNDIKVNAHNVGMLSDVVLDLKKQIHVMQEKLDNHVVSPKLNSKAVNCSTQTINTHYNECNNNIELTLNKSVEYTANCRTTPAQFQVLKCEDRPTNSEDISSDMSRVILDASLSSPSSSMVGNANSVVGFSEENSMRLSQPCNFKELSSNSLLSCVSGNHEMKQNNNPIPTRITRRCDNRPKFRHVKSNRKIASNKFWKRNNISSSEFNRSSKPSTGKSGNVTNSNGNSAKRCKGAVFRTHRKWKDQRIKWFSYYY